MKQGQCIRFHLVRAVLHNLSKCTDASFSGTSDDLDRYLQIGGMTTVKKAM